MSDSDNPVPSRVDFGAVLKRARETRNRTLEEVSEHLKIPVATLQALETGNIEALPVQTFTQGYIRSYARYLEVAEQNLLDSYNSHFPEQQEEKLKTRSRVASETTSRSPVVMIVSGLLLVAMVAAAVFGGVGYYRDKAGELGDERQEIDEDKMGSSLDSPSSYTGQRIEISQNARIADDGSLILTPPDPEKARAQMAEVANDGLPDTAIVTEDEGFAEAASASTAGPEQTAQSGEQPGEQPESQDVLVIKAELGSWVEVRDANDERLLYNMIPSRGDRTIIGQAPFKITMGNARTTQVVVNGLELNLADVIRPNNTASFRVSTDGQDIIFH